MINVIIPAYNCTKTLSKTLASLVAQTDSNFEVIVVDDCSTEDIKSIVDDYANKLSIIYIRNAKNMGCGMSRQVGLDNATQKFVTFLDSDDMFMPYTVETFNAIIEANPNIEYLHSYFYEQEELDGAPILIVKEDGFTWCHGKLYNTDCLKKYGIRWIPDVSYWGDDSYFNSICSELLQMCLIPVPTVLWVNNKDSVTRRYDPERDAEKASKFLDSILLSTEFVLQYKESITHLSKTVAYIVDTCPVINDEDKNKLQKLFNYIKGSRNGL